MGTFLPFRAYNTDNQLIINSLSVLNVVPQQLFTADFNGDGLWDFLNIQSCHL